MPDESPPGREAFDRDGFAFHPRLVSPARCVALASELSRPGEAGRRHLMDEPAVLALLQDTAIAEYVREVLPHAFAYKATLFDKQPAANWLVAWHRDQTIPVTARVNAPGWTAWSLKEDVHYVRPPDEVLSSLVALRIHLDDCDEANGPLRIAPGSHRAGATSAEQTITGSAGSALLMRPLLLHASSKSSLQTPRRILHLEFAETGLPHGLAWHRRVALGR